MIVLVVLESIAVYTLVKNRKRIRKKMGEIRNDIVEKPKVWIRGFGE